MPFYLWRVRDFIEVDWGLDFVFIGDGKRIGENYGGENSLYSIVPSREQKRTKRAEKQKSKTKHHFYLC